MLLLDSADLTKVVKTSLRTQNLGSERLIRVWLHSQFQLPANDHLRRLQVIPQVSRPHRDDSYGLAGSRPFFAPKVYEAGIGNLGGWRAEWSRDKVSSGQWFTPQMAVKLKTRIPLRSPMWVAGAQVLGPSFTTF